MKRTYIWRGRQPREKELVLFEVRSDEENGQEFLGVPAGTPGEMQTDILEAVRRAYTHGREDKAAELIPLSQPADALRAIVRDEAIGAISEWGTGWTSSIDDQEPRQHYITLEDTDDANHALMLAIGAERYDMTRRFRVSILVEEIEPR